MDILFEVKELLFLLICFTLTYINSFSKTRVQKSTKNVLVVMVALLLPLLCFTIYFLAGASTSRVVTGEGEGLGLFLGAVRTLRS